MQVYRKRDRFSIYLFNEHSFISLFFPRVIKFNGRKLTNRKYYNTDSASTQAVCECLRKN